jgi:prophage antirepressor-like protein
MNKLSIIEHQDLGCVRTQIIKGEPWFVAKDVCDVLGITKYRDAVARLDSEDKGCLISVDTLGGKQEMTSINESGLYNLIFQSVKPSAKPFKRWVTSEVLPSLRKYGKYVIPGSASEQREQQKLNKKEHQSMLREIDYHLTGTDTRIIAKKLFITEWDVNEVLSGYKEDVTVLVECIERATRNANASRKLRSSEVRKQIIALLRGVEVAPLVLE